jgi:Zn-dependent protease
MDLYEIGTRAVIWFVPFLFALCFHEYAHGWVAKLRGDNTAQMMGRLTMNPLAHMDFIGTFLLPMMAIIFPTGIFFGWAKPVPVNERNLKSPRTDMFWIALAGPASNIFLALIATFLMWVLKSYFMSSDYFRSILQMLDMFIGINLFLAFFNALPLHPLDGGKIIARFLPAEINYKLDQNQHITSMILLILILMGAVRFLAIPVQITHQFLRALALG